MTPRIVFMACAAWAAWSSVVSAEEKAWVRWNQAGYPADVPPSVVVMAQPDLAGQLWQLREEDGRVRAEGALTDSVTGAGPHAPFSYNGRVNLPPLPAGQYQFHLAAAEPAQLVVAEQPYARFIDQALAHLRLVRSGPDVRLPRRASHLGDARATVHVPDGDPAEGRWRAAVPARTVDAVGGWYDAGDQIKFTLNEAYTTYVLLLAYQQHPALFPAKGAGWPALLAEARHGLDFLARVYPDPDTFIIQVGDERDHNQPIRRPEEDPLDGQRPALCALSRVHMGAATAALALGARTFGARGGEDAKAAAEWADLARRIHARAQQPDVLPTAFERGHVNDFYHDSTDEDQQALAAAELYHLTGDESYLAQARRLAPPPATEVSWASWHALANASLAPVDPAALTRLQAETERYVEQAETTGLPWGVPTRLVWGSLHRWIGAAHATARAARLSGGDARREAVAQAIVNYTFGQNNWGVSFLFSPDLPNSVQNLYSPLYWLLEQFPTGALSEGPGNRATHEGLRSYFDQLREARGLPIDRRLEQFNTAEAVFSDDAADFMCQEATIGGQADLILLLTLASRSARAAP